VNATSAPKPVTECHFFVKKVMSVSKPHKHGLFTPFCSGLTRIGNTCSVELKTCLGEKRYRFTLQVGTRRIPLKHKWVILVRACEARLSVAQIVACL
jgi:hypothetical protein